MFTALAVSACTPSAKPAEASNPPPAPEKTDYTTQQVREAVVAAGLKICHEVEEEKGDLPVERAVTFMTSGMVVVSVIEFDVSKSSAKKALEQILEHGLMGHDFKQKGNLAYYVVAPDEKGLKAAYGNDAEKQRAASMAGEYREALRSTFLVKGFDPAAIEFMLDSDIQALIQHAQPSVPVIEKAIEAL